MFNLHVNKEILNRLKTIKNEAEAEKPGYVIKREFLGKTA